MTNILFLGCPYNESRLNKILFASIKFNLQVMHNFNFVLQIK